MIQEKLKGTDGFWDEKAQERLVVDRIDSEIGKLRGAVALAEKILDLKGNAGWVEFVKAIEDCRAHRRVELELSQQSDTEMRILQGRCRELGAIVSLMTQTEKNTEALVTRLRGLEEERRLHVREDGKVIPKGIS
jgi:hypothetical protein